MARGGLEPPTPRFSGMEPPYRSAVRVVAKGPRLWGIPRRPGTPGRSPRSPRYPQIPIVTRGFVPRGEVRGTNRAVRRSLDSEPISAERLATSALSRLDGAVCVGRSPAPPPALLSNPTLGYCRITGELRRVGVEAASSTGWTILKQAGIALSPVPTLGGSRRLGAAARREQPRPGLGGGRILPAR